MHPEQEFWIETTDITYLYYKVLAHSKDEAIERFLDGHAQYAGCNDENSEQIKGIVEDKPHMAWT